MSFVCEVILRSVRLDMLKVTSGLIEKIREGRKSNLFLLAQLETGVFNPMKRQHFYSVFG